MAKPSLFFFGNNHEQKLVSFIPLILLLKKAFVLFLLSLSSSLDIYIELLVKAWYRNINTSNRVTISIVGMAIKTFCMIFFTIVTILVPTIFIF